MTIKLKRLQERAALPAYAHGPDEDAGMDLCAVEEAILRPGVPTLVRTGLAIELPPGYEGQIRPRSGLALRHGITIPNAPGTIDPSFRGEIRVILLWGGHEPNGWWCSKKRDEGDGDPWLPKTKLEWRPCKECQAAYRIASGDRIAQLVIARYEAIEWDESDLATSARGAGGFGSTGI